MPHFSKCKGKKLLSLLINPVELSWLPLVDLLLLEPERNLLLCVLDAVTAVADVAANVDGEVATDGAWQAVLGVGGTEDGTAGLDGITTFPDHGANWAGGHVCSGSSVNTRKSRWKEERTRNETGEERLLGQVLVVLLEVLLRGGDELDSDELEAVSCQFTIFTLTLTMSNIPAVLEARDDWADESTL
jgi:hypothetical protein